MIRVIGVGERYRCDDAVGLVVAERLRASLHRSRIEVMTASGEGSDLMERWRGVDTAIVVDAVASDEEPTGTIHRWDAHEKPLPARIFPQSTHLFSLPQAVELARVLGELPRRLIVYGIVGADFRMGEGLSASVRVAIDEVVRRIESDTQAFVSAGNSDA